MGATSHVSLLQLTMSRLTNTLLGDVEDQPVLDSELVEEKAESLRVLVYRTECSYRLGGLAHLRGLCYLCIAHRDIKSDDLLVDETFCLKIMSLATQVND